LASRTGRFSRSLPLTSTQRTTRVGEAGYVVSPAWPCRLAPRPLS
jgi:hypothetical protein